MEIRLVPKRDENEGDDNDEKKKEAEVIYEKEAEVIYDESEGTHGKIWMDIGEFTQGLKDGLYEVTRWLVAPNTISSQ